MVLPVAQDGGDPRGAAEERMIVEARAAEEQMIAAAGPDLVLGRELLEGTQARRRRGALEDIEPLRVFAPRAARREIDLEDTRIRGNGEPCPGTVLVAWDVSGENGRRETQ